MKTRAERDLTVDGAHLAGQALRAGLVDECHLFLTPIVVGGGTAALPEGVTIDLELVDERRFKGGVVHLHYLVRG
jgi:dihydrofolate reductase